MVKSEEYAFSEARTKTRKSATYTINYLEDVEYMSIFETEKEQCAQSGSTEHPPVNQSKIRNFLTEFGANEHAH